MGLFGTILGTALDLVTTPIAMVKDIVPGCGGYVDGNRSKTADKMGKVADDLGDIEQEVRNL